MCLQLLISLLDILYLRTSPGDGLSQLLNLIDAKNLMLKGLNPLQTLRLHIIFTFYLLLEPVAHHGSPHKQTQVRKGK